MSGVDGLKRPVRARALLIDMSAAVANRWPIYIALSLFLLALAGALFLTMRTERLRAVARQHNDIVNTTNNLLRAVVDAESAQRGYLLTRDERYLAPFYATNTAFKALAGELTTQAADESGTQRARVAALVPIVDAKIAELQKTVDLERVGDHAGAIAILRSDSGRRLMDDLRARAEAVQAIAQHGLDSERKRLDINAQWLQADILAAFALGALLMGLIVRARNRLVRDLAHQNVTLEERVRERTQALEARSKRVETLMQDMSHRIGNALSLVTGFLDLQARASKSAEVKQALGSARQRVFSIASAQRRMRLAMDSDTVETRGFFEALIEDLRGSLPDQRIAITTDIEPGDLPSQHASAFGVILNELIANAFKHAWGPDEQGQLAVRFAFEDGTHVLDVADDGRGPTREDTVGGLGRILVDSLVQSMRGAMSVEPVKADPDRPGLRFTVRAPARA